MELLFAYDEKVIVDKDGSIYTGSTFSQSVFERYLQCFEHITLLARCGDIYSDTTRMNKVDRNKVSVVFFPDMRTSVKDFLNPLVRKTVSEIVEENVAACDAVIVRVPSVCGEIAAGICKKMRVPYLAEVVGCPWDSYRNHSRMGKIMAPVEWIKQRIAVRYARYAIYVTEQFLQKRYPSKGSMAGISDVELLPPDEIVLKQRLEKISKHCGKYILGTAGAVDVPYKGQQFVLKALGILKEKGNTDFVYQLAGGGKEEKLREMARELDIEDQVTFLGSLAHDDIFPWMDSLDIYIQPSLQDGLPRAVVEAMSRGLPVFGARTGGIPELLEERVIFDKAKADEIAALLIRIDNKQMQEDAKRNFYKAKEFNGSMLSEARRQVFEQYRTAIKNG